MNPYYYNGRAQTAQEIMNECKTFLARQEAFRNQRNGHKITNQQMIDLKININTMSIDELLEVL